ncbi:MAG TPA: hypothetical protein VEV20_01980 [Burkholderiales bacterium]|nr:hypothetical protein [Burkholderiales bacterium]
MSDVLKQPKRLTAQAIEQATLDGVARAIESRKAAGVELSAGDVDQISGGAMLNWQIAGGYPIGVLQAVQSPVVTVSQPAAAAAQMNVMGA